MFSVMLAIYAVMGQNVSTKIPPLPLRQWTDLQSLRAAGYSHGAILEKGLERIDLFYGVESQTRNVSNALYAAGGVSFVRTEPDPSYFLFGELGERLYGGGVFLPQAMTGSLGFRVGLPLPQNSESQRYVEGLLMGGLRWEPLLPSWKVYVGIRQATGPVKIATGIGMEMPFPFGRKVVNRSNDAFNKSSSGTNSTRATTHTDTWMSALGFPQIGTIDQDVRRHMATEMVCADGAKNGFLKWDLDPLRSSDAEAYRMVRTLMYLRQVRKVVTGVSDSSIPKPSELLVSIRSLAGSLKDIPRVAKLGVDSSAFAQLSWTDTVRNSVLGSMQNSIMRYANVSTSFWKRILDAHERSLDRMDKMIDRMGMWSFLLQTESDKAVESAMMRLALFTGQIAGRTAMLERSDMLAGACDARSGANRRQLRFLEAWVSLVAGDDPKIRKILGQPEGGCLERIGEERSECLATAQDVGLPEKLSSVSLDGTFISNGFLLSGDTLPLVNFDSSAISDSGRFAGEMALALQDTVLRSPAKFFENLSGQVFDSAHSRCESSSCLCGLVDSLNRRVLRTLAPIETCWQDARGVIERRLELLRRLVPNGTQGQVDSFFDGKYSTERLSWAGNGILHLNNQDSIKTPWLWVDGSVREPASPFIVHLAGLESCNPRATDLGMLEPALKVIRNDGHQIVVSGHTDTAKFSDAGDGRCPEKSGCKGKSGATEPWHANNCLGLNRAKAILKFFTENDTGKAQSMVYRRAKKEVLAWARGVQLEIESGNPMYPLRVPGLSNCLIGTTIVNRGEN